MELKFASQKNNKNRINELITAKEVRLVDHSGEMVGIVPIEKALEVAQSVNLDLVEIAPDSTPPVCKILDYSKQKYDIKRRQVKQKETKNINYKRN